MIPTRRTTTGEQVTVAYVTVGAGTIRPGDYLTRGYGTLDRRDEEVLEVGPANPYGARIVTTTGGSHLLDAGVGYTVLRAIAEEVRA